MKNKYLVYVIVPTLEVSLDMYIPNNKKIGTIKKCILQVVNEITSNAYNKSIEEIRMVDKSSGLEYENNTCIKDTGIKNGSKIIII